MKVYCADFTLSDITAVEGKFLSYALLEIKYKNGSTGKEAKNGVSWSWTKTFEEAKDILIERSKTRLKSFKASVKNEEVRLARLQKMVEK